MSQKEGVVMALDALIETAAILVDGLSRNDDEKAIEAISVMLMQGLQFFGPESPAMQQFFPVMDVIKTRIDNSDLSGALQQTRLFAGQLAEVKQIVLQA